MPVTLNMIPATLQEFQTCPQMDLSKPENTCAMFLCALPVSYTHLTLPTILLV